jgi:hypothetical protein
MDNNLVCKTSIPLLDLLIGDDAPLLPLLVQLSSNSTSSLGNKLIPNKVTIYNINKQLETYDRIILIVSLLLDCSCHHLFAFKNDLKEDFNRSGLDSQHIVEFSTKIFNFSLKLYNRLNQKKSSHDHGHLKKIVINYIIIVIPKLNSFYKEEIVIENFIKLLKNCYKEVEKIEFNNESISTFINLSDEKNSKIIHSSDNNNEKGIINNDDINFINNNNNIEKSKPIFQTSTNILSLAQPTILKELHISTALNDENNNILKINNTNNEDEIMIIDNINSVGDDENNDEYIKKRKIEDSIELITTANNYISNLNNNSPVMTENNKKLKGAILANIKTSLDLLKVLGEDIPN